MTRVLVVAKAPVPGRVKTRLGAVIGMEASAQVAAASLLDTLRACRAAYPVTCCHLALAGDITQGVRAKEIADGLVGWDVFEQRGADLAQRLVHAHTAVAERHRAPIVQIGMDTPQVTADLLRTIEIALDGPDRPDAVLGPAEDGGWWVLGLRNGLRATPLAGVSMSTPRTYDDTRKALELSGQRVVSTCALRDVDTVADADAVALTAPAGQFTAVWRDLRGRRTGW